ncbi:hypothetical protein [Mycolicibacterium confluentis]|uniref:Uncharacterized protein n=1 Tax=Mycolicibacterium confluentis TaxID=28047 RepID=A0A7I7Y013_9MYCO|nr:hypothetical protein [Mycolicibacterium confluentis]MCV7319471.1 hypothetical protein [Mycolicibacterium confluentis]ORV34105.1 hypothetical protein AWB99_00130 [Mycolicibacterium confluentis]BBZ34491.1 hypothetical protein MCNF_30960 [Mycolicibacterium confluentis]
MDLIRLTTVGLQHAVTQHLAVSGQVAASLPAIGGTVSIVGTGMSEQEHDSALRLAAVHHAGM